MALAEGRILYEFDDFVGFLESRPDHERWELVDGTLHMMAPPAARHQVICQNLGRLIDLGLREMRSTLLVLSNFGVHAPDAFPRTTAIPDLVLFERPLPEGGFTDGPVVVFEVLSPSTRMFDLGWKKPFYLGLPTLKAYVTVETTKPEIVVFQPGGAARGQRVSGLAASLDLRPAGLSAPLSAIYEDALP